ncbi:MAG TPA: GTP cyclohydrolase I [Streptosporangiaceae bacterium]|nr:GTP cyclohydrolase I [Streptosporangiaceae bacterium]
MTASAPAPAHGSNGHMPAPPQHSSVNGTSLNGTRPPPALLVAEGGLALDEAVSLAVEQDERQRPVDLAAAERAAADFLTALGIDLDREQRRTTPARMARAYAELLAAQPFQLTTFPNDEGYDELVLARAIPFRTLCEHHMLLFSGVAHVGYLPGERILGLSKLARLVEHFAAQPQTQERLTMQIAKSLDEALHPRGVGVAMEAEHTCMTERGIRALGATTVTSALLGALRTDPRCRAEFFALARVPTSPGPG